MNRKKALQPKFLQPKSSIKLKNQHPKTPKSTKSTSKTKLQQLTRNNHKIVIIDLKNDQNESKKSVTAEIPTT
jgi:hypothetical protein